MAADIDREGVEKAYGRWAPIYDLVFGKVFDSGRQSTIAEADRIGGRVLDVGVGTGLSLSDYSRDVRLCGVDISEPMGSEVFLYLDYFENRLTARVPPGVVYKSGSEITLGVNTSKIHLFDAETEEAIL